MTQTEIIGNPLLLPGSFFESGCLARKGILESIMRIVTADDAAVVNLVGPRWIGKSTVLRCLQSDRIQGELNELGAGRFTGKKVQFLYTDVEKASDPNNPLAPLAETIYRGLVERNDIELNEIAKEIALGSASAGITLEIVQNRLFLLPEEATKQGLRLVICVDHIDKSELLNDSYNLGMLELLANSASLILATRRTLTDIYPGLAGSPFVHRSIVLSLGLLGRSTAAKMLEAVGSRQEFKLSNQDIERLITLVGLHPFVLIRAAQQAYGLLIESAERREHGITFNDIRARIEPALRPIFEGLWGEYQESLLKYQRFEVKKDPNISEERKRAIRQELQRAELIYEDPNEPWKFNYFSPLFESYVIQKVEQVQAPNENLPPKRVTIAQVHKLLDLREGTKESAVIDILIDSAGKVVPDDHLQTQVWNGTDSNRAIVTTINRLRTKLGEHQDEINGRIVRIRNRGYRFEWLS